MMAPLLEFTGVDKSFFGVRVLREVTFSVPVAGAVGLVGENGAGKSTLMNILGGNVAPDRGQMRFAGADYQPATPQDAKRRGIALIHQELNLFPNLTVAENLFLTRFPRLKGTPLIDRAVIHQCAAELLREVGLEISTDQLVETLSPGERQLLEIAKALGIDARLVVFDEPTTSLTARETERLFALISRLRARGIAIIYISHTLNDVFRLCDSIVTLRDGAVVASGPADSFTLDKLVSAMVGREISQLFPARKSSPGKPLLEVRDLSEHPRLQNISLTVRSGEVVGLAGLMGAGRSELARGIFGLDPRSSGEIRIEGKILQPLNPRAAIEKRMAFVTENRTAEGLCLNASVAENLSLVSLPRHACRPFRWLMFPALNAAVRRMRAIVRLDPKTSDAQPVRTLSGGNQQKVVLGKWLLQEPKTLLLDEPTRGIDVGAKFEIYQLINSLAESGSAILFISSEIEELIGVSDRILVMRRGKIVREFERLNFDREQILNAALGSPAIPA